MAVTNGPRPHPPGAAAAAGDRPVRRRPDPNPLRLLIGFAGVASAAAVTSAMLPSVSGTPASATNTGGSVDGLTAVVAPQPSPSVITRYVTLKPGQTAPPDSTVVVRPQPTPQVTVRVVTRTRQSGKP